MIRAECPICEEKIDIGKNIKYLERYICPTCAALLEVANLDPVKLDWIYYDEYYKSNGRERNNRLKNAKCPLCLEKVHLGSKMDIGDRVICPGCDAQLEIISLFPPEIDWPYDSDDGFDYHYQDDDFFEERYDD
jgi:hypothetical protein